MFHLHLKQPRLSTQGIHNTDENNKSAFWKEHHGMWSKNKYHPTKK